MDVLTWIRQEHDANRARLHDWFVADVPAERWTERPSGAGCSFAWLVLHTAVHQDVAMQVAVRGDEPLAAAHWTRLGLNGVPWPALNERDALAPDDQVDVAALVTYADAVAAATTAWLGRASDGDLDAVPPTAERLTAAGVVADDVAWVAQRWSGRPVAWLVQWPAIGHTLLHHGEMAALRVPLGVRA